ncbi:MAG TPA: molybdopterin cofactor-binding domain-containing protein [Thermodesulfobacteriota bacterium]|nr:molybdopterin cofactor-binding domain-containing protein [Thermodesulfobacteriota bacterium]
MNFLDRRDFLKVLGGGLIVFISPGLSEAQSRFGNQDTPRDFNAFLRIGEDGRVTCLTGKIEMGQGIITSLAQMLAEELEVPFESVEMVMGDTDLCPWDMGTFGSRTTKYFGPLLREAAAQARTVLFELAAARLGLSRDRLAISNGVILDRSHPEKKVSYADLVKGKRIEKKMETQVALKPSSEFTLSGKPMARADGRVKVTGQAKYAGDIRVPGMLYARILRPPAHGATLKRVDTSAAEKIEGLKIVREGDLVAALHPLPDMAEKGRSLIKAEFETPRTNLSEDTIFSHLLQEAPQGTVISQEGSLEAGEKNASRKFEETYYQNYVAHAPMETHTALVRVAGKKATVWASTQTPFSVKEEAAQVMSFSPRDVRAITPFVGGGFGGKSWNRQAAEAARLALKTGRPVQVAWTREEEFFYDSFQPAAVVKIRSGLNPQGRIVFWDYHVYFAGERCAATFYDIPSRRTSTHGGWWGSSGTHPFATGTWRGPAANTNTFARECHMDAMAAASGADPLVFRLNHLPNLRMKRVLEKAASAFQWSGFPKRDGHGRGVACVDYLGTYAAAMAEVKVDPKSGGVQVKRVLCAQDMGQVINPEGARMQMEGCMMMGLGYALSEMIHFRGGEILDTNFDTYKIPRFSWMPKIEAVLVENQELPPQGGGEPAVTCMGAVIANAVFDAIKVRLFGLPMTPDRIQEAISRSRNSSQEQAFPLK